MDLNGLQSDTQHGYKKNHGTETLLVHFIDSLLVAVEFRQGAGCRCCAD